MDKTLKKSINKMNVKQLFDLHQEALKMNKKTLKAIRDLEKESKGLIELMDYCTERLGKIGRQKV